MVSILGIVFDCYLWLLLQSWGLLMVPVGNMGPIWPGEERRGNWGLWTEGRELGGRASLSEVYAAGRLQWHFACGFDFRYSLWLPLSGPEGAIDGSCGNDRVPFSLGGRAWGGPCGLCPKSRAWSIRASLSEVYLAGKFQWHFTCGLDFRHSLWLPFVTAFAVLKGLKKHDRYVCWVYHWLGKIHVPRPPQPPKGTADLKSYL